MEDVGEIGDIALQMHAAVTNVTAAWARSTWTWSCDLWPVWVRVSAPFKHYTNSPAVHLKYPAHLSGQGTETWMFEVIYTEQLDSRVSHFLTWCLIVELCHTTPGSTEQCGACRTESNWLFKKPLNSLNPWPPLHGLAFTNLSRL